MVEFVFYAVSTAITNILRKPIKNNDDFLMQLTLRKVSKACICSYGYKLVFCYDDWFSKPEHYLLENVYRKNV